MRPAARAAVMAAAIALSAGGAIAQSGAGYDLHWNAPGAGDAAITGAGYRLTGIIAQHAAATACANGYLLRSGFWAGVPENDVVFRSGFEPGC